MTENPGIHVLTDARWAELEPLIDEVRPPCKVPHDNLRETIEAILWRHQNGAKCQNGAKWRAIPGELGPWWKGAQTFIRWGRLGVWERLLDLVQQRGVALGMTFLDGTNLRAHQKAAGAKKGGATARSGDPVRGLAARVGGGRPGASPPPPPASGFGAWAPAPPFRPGAPTRRSPARTGSTTTGTWSR